MSIPEYEDLTRTRKRQADSCEVQLAKSDCLIYRINGLMGCQKEKHYSKPHTESIGNNLNPSETYSSYLFILFILFILPAVEECPGAKEVQGLRLAHLAGSNAHGTQEISTTCPTCFLNPTIPQVTQDMSRRRFSRLRLFVTGLV